MRYLFTTPCLAPHGGIHNIIELANCLDEFGHSVTLWVQEGTLKYDRIKIKCKVIDHEPDCFNYDCSVICSPHAVKLLNQSGKKVVWMQMIESWFKTKDFKFVELCDLFYSAKVPLISSATWGKSWLESYGREEITHVIGTGTNLNDYPIEYPDKTDTVLLESPISKNPVKDTERLALKTAFKLKKQFGCGCNVIGYGTNEAHSIKFYKNPDLKTINKLYSQAAIMVKATEYDFRSTAPLEAMTKGCVTVRAIKQGDEDLINGVNCLKSGYDYDLLFSNAARLLSDTNLQDRLRAKCYEFIKNNTWENLLPQYLNVLNA